MRKTLQNILASALLVGGLAACDKNHSPTAPPVPEPQRQYNITTVQQGPASLVVLYDQTWTEERARSVATQGLSDATNLINLQMETRGLVRIDGNVYLQGPIPGISFDTDALVGTYLPAGAPISGGNGIICAAVPGARSADECISHQLQHRYAQLSQCDRWRSVLHEDPRINTINTPGLVADTLAVTCEATRDPMVLAYEVDRFHCDTDGKE